MSDAARAWLALGSNLGARDEHLRSALDHLDARADLRVDAVSSAYETLPVGPSTALFLNAVARLVTTLSPRDLLAALHDEEARQGRQREVAWGARTLDLDLLHYVGRDGPVTTDEFDLRLPHPRLAEREFVLAPWAEVEPGLEVGGASVATLLARLSPDARTVLHRAPLGWRSPPR